MAIAPAELSLDDQRPPLALVRISGNFLFDPTTYIDFESALEAAGVTVAPCPWDQLAIAPPQTKHLTAVEASVRLDAVASAGFGLSRSKMSE
ncbi:hypothetical protein [Parathermosynechococcus lividus]